MCMDHQELCILFNQIQLKIDYSLLYVHSQHVSKYDFTTIFAMLLQGQIVQGVIYAASYYRTPYCSEGTQNCMELPCTNGDV